MLRKYYHPIGEGEGGGKEQEIPEAFEKWANGYVQKIAAGTPRAFREHMEAEVETALYSAYRHLSPQPASGPRWVKASERYPPIGKKVIGRCNDEAVTIKNLDDVIIKVGALLCHSIEILNEWFPGLEWLEESPSEPSLNDKIGKIQDERKAFQEWANNNAESDADDDVTLWQNGAKAAYNYLKQGGSSLKAETEDKGTTSGLPSPILEWIDAEDDLPNYQDEEYHLRYRTSDGWAPITGFYDNDAKQFYIVERDCNMVYLSLKEFPGLQWLKETASPRLLATLDKMASTSTPSELAKAKFYCIYNKLTGDCATQCNHCRALASSLPGEQDPDGSAAYKKWLDQPGLETGEQEDKAFDIDMTSTLNSASSAMFGPSDEQVEGNRRDLLKHLGFHSAPSVEADQQVPEDIMEWIECRYGNDDPKDCHYYKVGAIAMYRKMQPEIATLRKDLEEADAAARRYLDQNCDLVAQRDRGWTVLLKETISILHKYLEGIPQPGKSVVEQNLELIAERDRLREGGKSSAKQHQQIERGLREEMDEMKLESDSYRMGLESAISELNRIYKKGGIPLPSFIDMLQNTINKFTNTSSNE